MRAVPCRCLPFPAPTRRKGLLQQGARVFRPGDKVIQIRNNYDKGAAGELPTSTTVVHRQVGMPACTRCGLSCGIPTAWAIVSAVLEQPGRLVEVAGLGPNAPR